jgi:hypothetical protein
MEVCDILVRMYAMLMVARIGTMAVEVIDGRE